MKGDKNTLYLRGGSVCRAVLRSEWEEEMYGKSAREEQRCVVEGNEWKRDLQRMGEWNEWERE